MTRMCIHGNEKKIGTIEKKKKKIGWKNWLDESICANSGRAVEINKGLAKLCLLMKWKKIKTFKQTANLLKKKKEKMRHFMTALAVQKTNYRLPIGGKEVWVSSRIQSDLLLKPPSPGYCR